MPEGRRASPDAGGEAAPAQEPDEPESEPSATDAFDGTRAPPARSRPCPPGGRSPTVVPRSARSRHDPEPPGRNGFRLEEPDDVLEKDFAEPDEVLPEESLEPDRACRSRSGRPSRPRTSWRRRPFLEETGARPALVRAEAAEGLRLRLSPSEARGPDGSTSFTLPADLLHRAPGTDNNGTETEFRSSVGTDAVRRGTSREAGSLSRSGTDARRGRRSRRPRLFLSQPPRTILRDANRPRSSRPAGRLLVRVLPAEDGRGRAQPVRDALAELQAATRPTTSPSPTARAARRATRTVEITKWIKRTSGIEAMAHLTCVGETARTACARSSTRSRRGHRQRARAARRPAAGRDRVDAAPGRAPALGRADRADLARTTTSASAAACFPEVHPEAPDLEQDLRYLKRKVDAGRELPDHAALLRQRGLLPTSSSARARSGIDVPIIAGIMPITNFEQIKRFTSMCGATIPPALYEQLEARQRRRRGGGRRAGRRLRDAAVRRPARPRRARDPLLHAEQVAGDARDPVGAQGCAAAGERAPASAPAAARQADVTRSDPPGRARGGSRKQSMIVSAQLIIMRSNPRRRPPAPGRRRSPRRSRERRERRLERARRSRARFASMCARTSRERPRRARVGTAAHRGARPCRGSARNSATGSGVQP